MAANLNNIGSKLAIRQRNDTILGVKHCLIQLFKNPHGIMLSSSFSETFVYISVMYIVIISIIIIIIIIVIIIIIIIIIITGKFCFLSLL